MSIKIGHGDCRDLLQRLPSGSIDALVTDPPAGIKFMGVGWDSFADRKGDRGHDRSQSWDRVGGNHNPCNAADKVRTQRAEGARFRVEMTPIFVECLRVLKPGAHGVVWAIPRTSHWTATALEDAGFEIRDVITHHFGSGFPKSLDVSKAGAAGWPGWGTALKPASEHWILIRKPLIGTVVANVLKHGTGALNVDACRVDYASAADKASATPQGACTSGAQTHALPGSGGDRREFTRPAQVGRWPANLILSHAIACETGACSPGCPIAALDEQSGERCGAASPVKGTEPSNSTTNAYGEYRRAASARVDPVGGASRFFPRFRYQAKASRSERSAGGTVDNKHPTVKPIELMRWLIRLVTPPDGVVLDPFMGSGSTLVAAKLEGMSAIGIERDLASVETARGRIRAA